LRYSRFRLVRNISTAVTDTYAISKSGNWNLEEELMNMKQKLLAAAIALSALTSVAVVPAANAEVEVAASVGVSNMYYWRGFDLGGGSAVLGDVNVSASGFYAGAWASSGDEVMGTEY